MDIKDLQMIKLTQSPDTSPPAGTRGPDAGPGDTGRIGVGSGAGAGVRAVEPTVRFCTSWDRKRWGCHNGFESRRQPARLQRMLEVFLNANVRAHGPTWLFKFSGDRKLHTVCFAPWSSLGAEHRAQDQSVQQVLIEH